MSDGIFVDHNGKQLTINIQEGSTYVIVDANGTQIPFDTATAGGAGSFTSIDVSGDGNIDGNLTVGGTITGDLTGNVTGDVTGDLTGNADTATTAETVTVAAQPIITSVGRLTAPSDPPATASSPGVAGTITNGPGFMYHCTATDTWERVATSTW